MNLRFLSIINYCIVGWIIFLHLRTHFHWDLSAYGVIHEIIAVPILLSMPVFVILGLIAHWRHQNPPLFFTISLAALCLALLYTLHSFYG